MKLAKQAAIAFVNDMETEKIKELNKKSVAKYQKTDKGKKTQRKYYDKNKEKILNRQKEYDKNNKEKIAEYQRQYRAKKKLEKENKNPD